LKINPLETIDLAFTLISFGSELLSMINEACSIEEYLSVFVCLAIPLFQLLIALWQFLNKARRRKKLSFNRKESRTQVPAFLYLNFSTQEAYLVVYSQQ